MNKRILLFISTLTVALNSCGQNNLKLVANAHKDSVVLGTTVSINLALEGIDLNFDFEDNSSQDFWYSALVNEPNENKRFDMHMNVTPERLGVNKYGPYTISVLGKKITSNEVSIYTIGIEPGELKIISPSHGLVNEEIEIQVISYSKSNSELKLKDNEFFKVRSTSTSTTISNGKYSKTISLKVILKKKGILILNRDSFIQISENQKVRPVQIQINN
ncbi:hypothetical protein [Carboxylicivirga sp. RSCT41]|uniref:hypothetical protein n=1 Tax=Carboxylicivirga agarovorans TaxID=3417570 RepID=UPI003D34712C